ncbi:MAG: XdhC family protein [Anaerolineae bacterium]|nr:XdhC family protein [Anaerolineae bacterium]
MQEILTHLEIWQARGDTVALATVINTWGSSPRAPGAKMAVNQHGEMIGSVSGGCVEGAVVEEALAVIRTGRPKLLHYGVADEEAWQVGLACGGTIEILVERFQDFGLKDYLRQDKGVILATVVRGPEHWLGVKALIPAEGEPTGPLLATLLRDQLLQDTPGLLNQGAAITHHYALPAEGLAEVDVFFDIFRSAPRLVIIGAVHIASELVHFARRFGFCTYVVDPRRAFATRDRFPHVDNLRQQWPDEALPEIGLTPNTSVVVLSHDPKLDDPALKLALSSPVFYVGALGSPKTHAKRVERLLAEGLTQAQLDRLHAPIGLNIGGRSPAEIALSIMAEMVAVRNGKQIVDRK